MTRSNPKKHTTLYEEKYNEQNELYYEGYEVGRALGKGGFAHVYEIQQQGSPQVNAVKMISKLDKQGKQDPVYLEKIRSEIRIMQMACQGCDQVVQYLHSFTDSDYVYILMELCPLGSLNDMVKRRKTLSEPEVRFFLVQMISILVVLREKNIIHRDIKLANFFVSSDYRLKLGDFGLATLYNDDFRSKRSVCGTPNYIAPEVIEKKEYAFEVDLWAIGVIIFTMLLGVPPFETKSCKETYDKIKSCSFKFEGINKNIKISEEAKMLIRDILVHDPKRRIAPEQMLKHPFLAYFPMPPSLEPDSYRCAPNNHFLKKYSNPITKAEITAPAKPQINETTLQKKDRPVSKQLYRNIKVKRKKEGPKGCHQEEEFAEREFSREQEQRRIKLESSKTGKLENSISIKKRDFSAKKDKGSPHKKFRHNFQPINDSEHRDLTPTMVKQPLDDSDAFLAVSLELTDQNLLHLAKMRPLQLPCWSKYALQSRPQEAIGELVQRQGEATIVTWHQISQKTGVVYLLNSKAIGAIFPEGTKMVLSNISKIEYVERGKDELLRENNEDNFCLSEQVELLNSYFLKLNLDGGNPPSRFGHAGNFVKGFVSLPQAAIFNFGNDDIQVFFQDGPSIVLKRQIQKLICHFNQNKLIKDLPLQSGCFGDPYLEEKVSRAFLLVEEVGNESSWVRESREHGRVGNGRGWRGGEDEESGRGRGQ